MFWITVLRSRVRGASESTIGKDSVPQVDWVSSHCLVKLQYLLHRRYRIYGARKLGIKMSHNSDGVHSSSSPHAQVGVCFSRTIRCKLALNTRRLQTSNVFICEPKEKRRTEKTTDRRI